MALAIRERITEHVQPLLEPGEQVQAVIPAQTKSGWLGLIGFIWLVFVNRYRPSRGHRSAHRHHRFGQVGHEQADHDRRVAASEHPDRAATRNLVEVHDPRSAAVRPQAIPQRRRARRFPAPDQLIAGAIRRR